MKLIDVQPMYAPTYALESIINIKDKSFESMIGSISNFFPSLKAAFQGGLDSLGQLKAFPSSLLSSISGGNSFFSSYKQVSYDDFKELSKIKIVTPESFSGNLYEYSQFLKNSWMFLDLKFIPELDIYYAQLASFATNKEAKLSIVDKSASYIELQKTYESLVKESKSYYGEKTHNKRTAELGICFSDYQQFKSYESTTLELARELNERKINNMVARVKKINDVLAIIIEEAKNKNYDKASYETVKTLAAGVFALAEIIEFFSITYYRITELAHVVKENRDILKKLK